MNVLRRNVWQFPRRNYGVPTPRYNRKRTRSCSNCEESSSSAIDVSPLANKLRSKIREYTRTEHLKLVGILANHGSQRYDSDIYSERIAQNFLEDGIDYELWSTKEKRNPALDTWIKHKIQIANRCKEVHGVLIFYPIYPRGLKGPYKSRLTGVYYKTQDDHLRDLVSPTKDVEGLCSTKWFNVRDSSRWQKDAIPSTIYPCTAMSVLKILQEYHINTYHEWGNQTISIVNRSEIIGRPLAVMLAQMGATVYSIDVDSILQFRPNGERLRRCNTQVTTLKTCLRESNVVVTGVPHADFQLPLYCIAEGATVVNVSEFYNVCEETLLTQRPDIKYIPQVGKVTVAVLENNLMNLKIRHSI